MVLYRLLVLTFVTYFLMASNAKFQDISDAYGSNEIVIIGIGSFLFILFLRFLHPLTSTTTDEIFTPQRFEKRFVPGFLHGAVLAVFVAAAFLLSGLYRYLGFYIQFEEAPLALVGILLRVAALFALAYCEEFIFRYKVMFALRREVPDLYAAGLTALLYCGVKLLQFDLSWMQLITLFLISFALSIRTISDGDFMRGAGYWAGLLIVLHPFLSLPILGNEFQGILIIKYQGDIEAAGTSRFLTGGIGGPLSSFALQLLFLIDVLQGIYRNKKILLST
jgi:hypothetical protein